MGLASDLLAVGILLFFALIIYMKQSGKSLKDVIDELKGGFANE